MDIKDSPPMQLRSGPTANFTVGDGAECGTSPVIFNDLSTPAGTITKWSWNLAMANPNHLRALLLHTQYTDTGNFTPALTVQDLNGCTDSFTLPTKVLITKSAAKFGSDYSTHMPRVQMCRIIDSSADMD